MYETMKKKIDHMIKRNILIDNWLRENFFALLL